MISIFTQGSRNQFLGDSGWSLRLIALSTIKAFLIVITLLLAWMAVPSNGASEGVVAEMKFLQQLAATAELVGGVDKALKDDRGGNPEVLALALEVLQTISTRLNSWTPPAVRLEPMHKHLKDVVESTHQALQELQQQNIGNFKQASMQAEQAWLAYLEAWQEIQQNYR